MTMQYPRADTRTIKCCPVRFKIARQFTSFLTTNYGEEYVAKMKTNTTTFDEAPKVIQQLTVELASIVEKVFGARPDFQRGGSSLGTTQT